MPGPSIASHHAPERTLLDALVRGHYPDFLARLEAEVRGVPAYVRADFDAYLRINGGSMGSGAMDR